MNNSEILKMAQEFNRAIDENKAEEKVEEEPSEEDQNRAWTRFEKNVERNRKIPTHRLPYFNQLNDSMVNGIPPSEDDLTR